MEIYKENISQFLNGLGLISLFFFEPTYQFILYTLPYSLVIPMIWGGFLGVLDNYIDWEI